LEDKIFCFKDLAMKYYCLRFYDERKDSSVWTREEIAALQKAVKKFPAGTVNRWEKIEDMVKSKGTSQIISMSHYIAMNPNLKFTGESVDLDNLLSGNSNGGNNKNGKNGINGNKENKEVKEFKEKKEIGKENVNGNGNLKEKKMEKIEKVDKIVKNDDGKDEEKKEVNKETGKDDWNDDQQKALESALRKYASITDKNEKWEKIAGDVVGKSKKQCVERFKFLATLVKKSNTEK